MVLLKEHALYKFGDFAIDPVAKVLFRDGEPVHMTRKAVETLLVLVEHSGQVLTKDEIMRAVWSDRVVDEANLAQNIAVIRRTLGAAKGSPAYIETFPGRGYRLEGPVSAEQQSPPAPAKVDAPQPTAMAVEMATPGRTRWVLAAAGALALIAAVAFFFWPVERKSAEGDALFRVTPITRLPGKEYQPAISADGKRIAFVWTGEDSKDPSIWVTGRGESSPRRVSSANGHFNSPAWSQDGKQLAYLRTESDALRVVIADLERNQERVIGQFPASSYPFEHRMLDWSPDGQWLVIAEQPKDHQPSGLTLIAMNSDKRLRLTSPAPEVSISDVDPRFAPDGKHISFVRLISRAVQEVMVVPIERGEAKAVTNFGRRISAHDWSGPSQMVVASDRSGEFRLWRVPLRHNAATSALRSLGIYGEFPIQFSISRTGDVLAYASLHQDRNIWELQLDGLKWKRIAATTAQDASPVYSPTGDRICFRSDRSGEDELWVSDADGANPVQITKGPIRPSVGRWSPDGTSIVFNNPSSSEIFVASLSGTAWTVRSTGLRGVHPVFSTDGKWIFAGGSDLRRFPVGGGEPVVLAKIKAEALVVSPDGAFVYFVPEPSDRSLWRVSTKGGSPEKVLDGLVPGCTSCWSVAAGGIYYLGFDSKSFNRQQLLFHDFRRKESPRVVVEYPEPLWPLGSGPFSLSPNGKSLLCVRVAPSESDAMLVTPFR